MKKVNSKLLNLGSPLKCGLEQISPALVKVQLTPKFFFAYINLFVSLITAAKKLSL